MSGEEKSDIYKTLNECVAALNNEMTTGQQAVYVTIDRAKHTALLAKIAECKRLLVRANTKELYDT